MTGKTGKKHFFLLLIGIFLTAATAHSGCDRSLSNIAKADVVIVGFGGVGNTTAPLVLKDFPDKKITVFDFQDKHEEIAHLVKQGVNFVQKELTRDNLADTLNTHLKPGGHIIDAAWYIETEDFIRNANRLNATFQNTSLEQYRDQVEKKSGVDKTLYVRHQEIDAFAKKMGSNSRTAILENGANPGWVTHALRMGLIDIAHEYIKRGFPESKTKEFEDALRDENFGALARILQTRVIHIAELDTQITNGIRNPKKFKGVWSIDGLFSEGNEPAEGALGIHEDVNQLPKGVKFHKTGPKNQFYMASTGFETFSRSSAPGGLTMGNIIPHGETNDNAIITSELVNGVLIPNATHHYVYQLPLETRQSMLEWRKKGYPEPALSEMHYMNTDIVSGRDELGIAFYGSKVGPWWTGSLLDIDTARKRNPKANATTEQVGAELVAGLAYAEKNPNQGIQTPKDLPYKDFMKIVKPRLEPWYSGPIASPVELHPRADGSIPDEDLQFERFLITPRN